MRWPNALRWKGSVIPRILPKLIFFLLWSALWTCLHQLLQPHVNFSLSPSLITILGIVTGLLLVFRTNTAYDRYWEGRRLWSNMVVAIRNLTRQIYVSAKGTSTHELDEKRSAIRLLMGFAAAVKHYLRQEYGPNYEDVLPYIQHLKKYNMPSSVEPLTEDQLIEREEEHSHSRRSIDINQAIKSNLPLELTLYIGAYMQFLRDHGRVEPPLLNVMITTLNQLVDSLTGYERILRTPIPLAYSIHLSQTVWVFCLALPFQLLGSLGWVTIPAVVISAFTLFGIESIGGEIENPFGYDDNDLPLDDFCRVLRREIEVSTSIDPPKVDDWIIANAGPKSQSLTRSQTPAQIEIISKP